MSQALENPKQSFAKYQADVITRNADVVTEVTQAGADKLKNLQLQHQVE